jgi:RNA-binding protein NOB1
LLFRLCRDVSRTFCAACGNHTLIKVTVTINSKGIVRYWHGNRHFNTRGTIYSIPKPRGGREHHNLKLSEDSMLQYSHKLFSGKKNDYDAFTNASEFAYADVGKERKTDVYGYGRKNPNVPKKTGNKKKNKKY